MISNKEYFHLCSRADYLKEKTRFYKQFNIVNLSLMIISNIAWAFKDTADSNMWGNNTVLFISLLYRCIPILFIIPTIILTYKESKFVTLHINICIWSSVVCTFFGLAYGNANWGYNCAGDSWLAFYGVFFLFAITTHHSWIHPLSIALLSFLIWVFDKTGKLPCDLSVHHVVSMGVLLSIPAWISSIYLKKLFASYYLSLKHYKQIAKEDTLTGCYNRAIIEDITKNNKLISQDNTIIILDIDNFKRINDNYGHLIGDKVLIETVIAATSIIDEKSLVIRYGGDEFIIYIPRVTNPMVLREKFLNNISKFLRKYKITFSFGATFAKAGDDLDETIKKADTALYSIKNINKNGIAIQE